MKVLTSDSGWVDSDEVYVTAAEIEATIAAWDVPLPDHVRRGGTPAPVTAPLPEEWRGVFGEIVLAINGELGAAGFLPLPLSRVWGLCNAQPRQYASNELSAAIRRAFSARLRSEQLSQVLGNGAVGPLGEPLRLVARLVAPEDWT